MVEVSSNPAQNSNTDAAQAVRSIAAEASELGNSIDGFVSFSKSSKEYRYYEEMLTRLLLRLDNVETGGSEEIRMLRREAVKSVQAILERLERKATGA